MSNLSQYDGWTVEEIVARNSHELTALHLLNARAHIVAMRAEHRREMHDLSQAIEETHQVGRRVLEAKHRGRKTVRIDEVAP